MINNAKQHDIQFENFTALNCSRGLGQPPGRVLANKSPIALIIRPRPNFCGGFSAVCETAFVA